ncbi:MAG: hypothetical protein ABJB85_02585 [Nitrososphaerota archaeon]
MQSSDDHYRNRRIQIEMKPASITIRMEVYDGVLTETRFDGVDSYVKLLNHLKSINSGENIHAILNIRD